MRRLCFLAAVFALQACGCDVENYAIDRFEVDAQGWTLVGDADNPTPELATEGDPGGCICGTDNPGGEIWYFAAPQKYLGNASETYGQRLSFSLKQNNQFSLIRGREVVMTTDGVRLSYSAAEIPGLDWTPFSVPLSVDDRWKNDSTNAVATEAELKTVLRNVRSLRIRGEYTDGPDRACLDNVIFGTP